MVYKSIELLFVVSIVIIFLISIFIFLNSIVDYKSVTGLSRAIILYQEIENESLLNINKSGYVFSENLNYSTVDVFLFFINNQVYVNYLLYSFLIDQFIINDVNSS